MELNELFSGIGSTLAGCLFSLVVGGVAGYSIGFHKGRNQQIQKAGNHATQIQIGDIHHGNESK